MNTQEIINLRQVITTANKAYREGKSLLTDAEYDAKVEQLRQLDPNDPLLNKIGHTVKDRKESLPIPMFSLNKLKSIEEILKWGEDKGVENNIIIITPKFDGISLVADDCLGKCWTRGDGVEGQRSDKYFASLSKTGHSKTGFYTFGEAIISKKNFKKHSNKFATARNMVVGLFNQKEATEELKDVDYIRYGSSLENMDKMDQIYLLNDFNTFEVPIHICTIKDLTEDVLNALFEEWSELYQIDGLVIDIDSAKLRNKLGRELNNNPAYARAVKLPHWSGTYQTKVQKVVWKVSKQGKLKPVIQIEPVMIDGVKVENVTGYNAKYIKEHNISNGSIIEICRSGDVIPKHLRTIKWCDFSQYVLPVKCPCCGTVVSFDATCTELICSNPECEDKLIAKMIHFFNTMGLEEYGATELENLWKNNFCSIDCILNIDEEELIKFNGWGEKSSADFQQRINDIRLTPTPLSKILHALDLMNGKIGEKTIQLIFDHYPQIQKGNLINIDELCTIKGVSRKTAEVLYDGMAEWFDNYFNDFDTLLNIRHTKKKEQSTTSTMAVCFTGFRDKELESAVVDKGGKVVSGVSKNTTHLIVKELDSGSSKMQKAEKLGIQILNIEQFKDFLKS